jgi:hypothetical protein
MAIRGNCCTLLLYCTSVHSFIVELSNSENLVTIPMNFMRMKLISHLIKLSFIFPHNDTVKLSKLLLMWYILFNAHKTPDEILIETSLSYKCWNLM